MNPDENFVFNLVRHIYSSHGLVLKLDGLVYTEEGEIYGEVDLKTATFEKGILTLSYKSSDPIRYIPVTCEI